jgi:hypothetical protein
MASFGVDWGGSLAKEMKTGRHLQAKTVQGSVFMLTVSALFCIQNDQGK